MIYIIIAAVALYVIISYGVVIAIARYSKIWKHFMEGIYTITDRHHPYDMGTTVGFMIVIAPITVVALLLFSIGYLAFKITKNLILLTNKTTSK